MVVSGAKNVSMTDKAAANIHVFPDRDALINAAAERIIDAAANAINAQGRFSIGLSGGSTPRPLFKLLARDPFASEIEWDNVYVFWGDERCVPPDDEASNYHMAQTALLDHVPLPGDNIKRIRGELNPAQAAEEYEHTLRMFFPGMEWPRVDLLLQGMGDDGHTASLFPNTTALHERTRWVAANYVPKLDTWRITLTVPAINAADTILFLVAGAEKAPALQAVLYGPPQPETYPSQLVQPTSGTLHWLVDAAASPKL